MPQLKKLTPVLVASAVEHSVAFWCERLGLKVTNQVPGPDGKLIFASATKRHGPSLG